MSDSESIASSSAWSEGTANEQGGTANVRVKFAHCQDGAFKVAGRNEGTKLQPGDTLTHVAGTPVEGIGIDELRRMLRGAPKSLVEVRLTRGWAQIPIRAQLLRKGGRRPRPAASPPPQVPSFRDMPAPEAGFADGIPEGLGELPPPPIPGLGEPPLPLLPPLPGEHGMGAAGRERSLPVAPSQSFEPTFRALPAPSPDVSVASSAASAPAAFRGFGPGSVGALAAGMGAGGGGGEGGAGRVQASPAVSVRAAVTPQHSMASSVGGDLTPGTDAALVRRSVHSQGPSPPSKSAIFPRGFRVGCIPRTRVGEPTSTSVGLNDDCQVHTLV